MDLSSPTDEVGRAPACVCHKRFFAFEQCDSARVKQKIANVLKMWSSPEQLPLFCGINCKTTVFAMETAVPGRVIVRVIVASKKEKEFFSF